MCNDKMDDLLKDICTTRADNIKGIGDIDIPPMSETMSRFRYNLERQRLMECRKFTGFIKGPVLAATILITSLMLSIAFEPRVEALRLDIVNILTTVRGSVVTIKYSSNPDRRNLLLGVPPQDNADSYESVKAMDIEEARRELPFHLYVPEHLPAGYKFYKLESHKYNDGMYMIVQSYRDDNKGVIAITQTSHMQDVNLTINYNKSDDTQFRDINIMEVDAKMITGRDFSSITWFKDGFKYSVYASLGEDEFLNILHSLK